MYNKSITAAALMTILLVLAGVSETFAQGKGGAKGGGGGGGFGGADPMSTRGAGDPRAGTGSDRLWDPTGSRSKDPFLTERVSDPTFSRTTKDPLFIVSERYRPFELNGSRTKPETVALTPNDVKRVTGIARKLNTTPTGMKAAYLAALSADRDLSFGQFVAAHVVADNLRKQYPSITASAILAGMQNGDSLGRTLRNFGLTADQAKAAEKAAKKQIAESSKAN